LRHFRIVVSIALLVAIVDARDLHAESMWDSLMPAIKSIETAEFCNKNRGHERCKELEAKRAFCAKNPERVECREERASARLLRCERNDPGSLGGCHAAIIADLGRGLREVPELRCVPEAVLDDPEQLRRLFIREANRNPEVLHLPARNLLYYAVVKAFPCPLRAR
jgi:hypothetical protein